MKLASRCVMWVLTPFLAVTTVTALALLYVAALLAEQSWEEPK